MTAKRFLHLDFKGIVPGIARVSDWLSFFRKCGFDGIVFEFDCRVRWRTWPQAGMPVFSPEEAAGIVRTAEQLGLETIPLMQIHGHLEWMLGEGAYASLRENGRLVLCPSNPDSRNLLTEWMHEIREIFPNSRYIHLGADEVSVLGECPRCRKIASACGIAGLYLQHVDYMSRHALKLGMRPIIWGDMLLKENFGGASGLASEVIFVDWQYWGKGPFASTSELKKTGHEVWGASSAYAAWYEHFHMMMNYPQDRLENVLGWNQYEGTVIHTCWARSGNKWNLYPPLCCALPVLIAAGNPNAWEQHPWHDVFPLFAECLRRGLMHELDGLGEKMRRWPCADEFEKECLDYLLLGLEYDQIWREYLEIQYGRRCMDAAIPFIGKNPAVYDRYFISSVKPLQQRLDALMEKTGLFFNQYQLHGKEEFLAEKKSVFQF